MPHEHTLSKPKEDRLNLIREVKANLSPIFALFDDASSGIMEKLKKAASEKEPMIDMVFSGIRERLWRVDDTFLINEIAGHMKEKKVFIADGHHRYEVAKTYRDQRRRDPEYNGEADHVMMCLTDLSRSSDLSVLATHRAVKTEACEGDVSFKRHLKQYFTLSECEDLTELMERLGNASRDEHVFGLYAEGEYIFLKPGDDAHIRKLIPQDKSGSWKELDVSVLHSAIIERVLCPEEIEGNITYFRDPVDAVRAVDDRTHKVAFFLRPTPVDKMRSVAEGGEMMPQKSTYFYPKLCSGLVMNRFEPSKREV